MRFLDAVRTVTSPFTGKATDIGGLVVKGWEELRAGLTTVTGTTGTLAPVVKTDQAIKKYRSWVYPVVNQIARKVTTVDYYLYQAQHKRNREKYEKIYDHPMLKLLNAPNKFLSGRQFHNIIQMYLDLCGFACARILRKGSGQPGELHLMYPEELIHIELGTSTDQIIKSFWFAPLGNKRKIEKIPYRDMLYWHYPHPVLPYLPYTPIEALAHVTDIDLYLQVYEKAFFANNTRPDYIIIPGKSLSRPAAERVVEGLKAKHQGPGKNALPTVLSEDVKIEQLSMSAKDFEFVGLSGWTLDHICSAYSTPKAMIGLLADFNRASSITAEGVWVKTCIDPRLDLWEDVVNHQLLPNYRNTEGYEFEFESALPKDDEWDLAKNTGELNAGLVTPNEIRERNGDAPFKSPLAKVPWMNGRPIPGENEEADKLWTESQMPPAPVGMPGQEIGSNLPAAQGPMGELGGRPEGSTGGLSTLIAATLRNSRPGLSQLLRAARGHRGGLRALIEANPEMVSINSMLGGERATDMGLSKLMTRGIRDHIKQNFFEEDDSSDLFETFEDLIAKCVPLEEEYEQDAKDFFVQKGAQLADIVCKQFTNITTKEPVLDIDEEDLKESYKSSVSFFATKACEAGFQAGYELVRKAGGNVEPPEEFTKASLAAAGKYLEKSSDLKIKTTKKALTDIIKEALEKGYDSETTGDLIRERFNWIGSSRAEMIARTEINAAVAEGLSASYKKINKDAGTLVVQKTVLYVSLDERLCKECRDQRGDTVEDFVNDEVFISLPIHPRCRCGPQPVLATKSLNVGESL